MSEPQLEPGLRASLSRFAPSREEAVRSGVELREGAPPSTALLQPHDVIVEVRSASVAYIDLLMLSGQYHHKPRLPYTPGLEYAGVVRWVGPSVESLRPGDRVMNDFLRSGPRSAGEYQGWGGWARYAVAPEQALLRVPDPMSFDAACNTLLNYETAVFALADRARVMQGESVLVTGATGAAGLAAIQVAKLLGAGIVIATGRGRDRLAAARELGADHTIDLLTLAHASDTSLRDAVRDLTGRGADVLFDTVGGEWLIPAVRALDFDGRMTIIGWAANTAVAKGEGAGGSVAPDLLPTNLIQIKGLTVIGSPMVISGQKNPQARARRLATITQWMQLGLLTPVVTRSYALQDLQAAMQARLTGVVGGCVVNT